MAETCQHTEIQMMQNVEEKSDGGYGVHFHIYAFLKESANVC